MVQTLKIQILQNLPTEKIPTLQDTISQKALPWLFWSSYFASSSSRWATSASLKSVRWPSPSSATADAIVGQDTRMESATCGATPPITASEVLNYIEAERSQKRNWMIIKLLKALIVRPKMFKLKCWFMCSQLLRLLNNLIRWGWGSKHLKVILFQITHHTRSLNAWIWWILYCYFWDVRKRVFSLQSTTDNTCFRLHHAPGLTLWVFGTFGPCWLEKTSSDLIIVWNTSEQDCDIKDWVRKYGPY